MECDIFFTALTFFAIPKKQPKQMQFLLNRLKMNTSGFIVNCLSASLIQSKYNTCYIMLLLCSNECTHYSTELFGLFHFQLNIIEDYELR